MTNETQRVCSSLIISNELIEQNYFKKNVESNLLLTRKRLIQDRLMRWFAFILALATIVLIWQYISILILAIWLSTICKPLFQWLNNHL